MSLKGFHFLTVMVTTLMCGISSVLTYNRHQVAPSSEIDLFYLSIFFAIASLGLLIYGIWYLRSTKHLIV